MKERKKGINEGREDGKRKEGRDACERKISLLLSLYFFRLTFYFFFRKRYIRLVSGLVCIFFSLSHGCV